MKPLVKDTIESALSLPKGLDDFLLILANNSGLSRLNEICWNSQATAPSGIAWVGGGPVLNKSLTLRKV